MPNSYFRFKQFLINQNKTAMKVGTDGVLLGAWVDVSNAGSILDIGTGTGLIAIMLAQRSDANIDAVEIEESAASQARENIANCKWAKRISIFHQSVQKFAVLSAQKYDLIVSNPPYFTNSLKSSDLTRDCARHTEQLPYHELLSSIDRLLSENGRFAGIFPYVEGNTFIAMASAHGLYCTKKTNVYGKTNGRLKRLLLEFRRTKIPLEEDSLEIRTAEGNYAEKYIELTKDFYLDF